MAPRISAADSPWEDTGAINEAMEDLRRAGLQTVAASLPELPFSGSRFRAAAAQRSVVKTGSGVARVHSLTAARVGKQEIPSRQSSCRNQHRIKQGKLKLMVLGKDSMPILLDRGCADKEQRRRYAVFVESPLIVRLGQSLDDDVVMESEGFRGVILWRGEETISGEVLDIGRMKTDILFLTKNVGFEGKISERPIRMKILSNEIGEDGTAEADVLANQSNMWGDALKKAILPQPDSQYFCGGAKEIIPSIMEWDLEPASYDLRSIVVNSEFFSFGNQSNMMAGLYPRLGSGRTFVLTILGNDEDSGALHDSELELQVIQGVRGLPVEVSLELTSVTTHFESKEELTFLGDFTLPECDEGSESDFDDMAKGSQAWSTMIQPPFSVMSMRPLQLVSTRQESQLLQDAIYRPLPAIEKSQIQIISIMTTSESSASSENFDLPKSKGQMTEPEVELKTLEIDTQNLFVDHLISITETKPCDELERMRKCGAMLTVVAANRQPLQDMMPLFTTTFQNFLFISQKNDDLREFDHMIFDFQAIQPEEPKQVIEAAVKSHAPHVGFDGFGIDGESEGEAVALERDISRSKDFSPASKSEDSPEIDGNDVSDKSPSKGETIQLHISALTGASLEDDLDSFMKCRGIDLSGAERAMEATKFKEVSDTNNKSMTRIRLDIEKDSALAKVIYDLRCIITCTMSKLEEQQIVRGHVVIKPDYVLAIANNVRSQIEESQCTIATTKLVMTWSALMTVYMLSKLVDYLVKQGPAVALAFFASTCEDCKWDRVLSAVLQSAKHVLMGKLDELCDGVQHPHWPALQAKVCEVLATDGLKPGVLVKSSLLFESVSRALYGMNILVKYFKGGESRDLAEAMDGSEVCVIVMTEQALLECNYTHYAGIAVLYHFLTPGPGLELLVGEFKKTTQLEIVEPRIEQGLLETGAMSYSSIVNVMTTTESLWVDSSEELAGGAILHRSVKIKVLANAEIMQRRLVLMLLEEENIGTIERPDMKPDLACGGICIVVRDADQLAPGHGTDNCSGLDELLLCILELSIAFTDVWVIIEQGTDSEGRCVGYQLDAEEWIKLHGIAGCYGVRCHVRQVFSDRHLTVEIRAAIELSCGLAVEGNKSTPMGACHSFCNRDDLVAFAKLNLPVEEESDQELFLASFPSLNISSAQAVLRCIAPHNISMADLVRGCVENADIFNLLATVLDPKILQGFQVTCFELIQNPLDEPELSSPISPAHETTLDYGGEVSSPLLAQCQPLTDRFFENSSLGKNTRVYSAQAAPTRHPPGEDYGRSMTPDRVEWVVEEYDNEMYPRRNVSHPGQKCTNLEDTWREPDVTESCRKRRLTVVRTSGAAQTRLAWADPQPMHPSAESFRHHKAAKFEFDSPPKSQVEPKFIFDCQSPEFNSNQLCIQEEPQHYSHQPAHQFSHMTPYQYSDYMPLEEQHYSQQSMLEVERSRWHHLSSSDDTLHGAARNLEQYAARESDRMGQHHWQTTTGRKQGRGGHGWWSNAEPERTYQAVQKSSSRYEHNQKRGGYDAQRRF